VNIHWIHNFFTVQHFLTLALALKNRVFLDFFHCIDYTLFIIQDIWAICACPEKQIWPEILHCIEMFLSFRIFEQIMFAWNFSLYWIYFLHSGFLSNLRLTWKAECALNSLTDCIFLSFRVFEQLALALKNRVVLKIFTVLKYFLLFRYFEQLALVLITEFALKFFTGLKYFLSFRNFEQLALVLKTEFTLKIFKPGCDSPFPATCLVRLWAYGIEVVNLSCIGTPFWICSKTCTPLQCTKIYYCKSTKFNKWFLRCRRCLADFKW